MRRRIGFLQNFFAFCAAILTLVTTHAQQMTPSDELPFGVFPHLRSVQNESSKEIESLSKEVVNLSTRFKDTVKDIASHRNTTCFWSPCLFQAFPIIYTKIGSGFYGGLHAKLTNIARTEPYLFSLEGHMVRSDTQQWLTYLASDFPQISFLPLKPRFKLRVNYARSTESRYYGIGSNWDIHPTRPDEEYRYGLIQTGAQMTLIVPLAELDAQKVSLFTGFSRGHREPSRYRQVSRLFEDAPLGVAGGNSGRFGIGFLIDSRDQEVLSRKGWALEASAEYGGPPFGQFVFQRFSLIDKRYFSKGIVTLASRLSLDSLSGNPPYWELEGIGGIDPIADVTDSMLLRGFLPGRFHEKLKLIESLEIRVHLQATRIFGLLTQVTLIPIGADLARLSDKTAASLTSGAKLLFNRNLLVQAYGSASQGNKSVYLDFGQEF